MRLTSIGTATVLAGALVLGACSSEDGADVTDEDVERIEQTLAEGSALSWELTQAEARVAQHCMEDLDFSVHDPGALHGNMVPHRFDRFSSPYQRIPTVTQAEKFGFGQWMFAVDADEAAQIREDPDYLAYVGDEAGWEDPGEPARWEEFKAADEDYKEQWYRAFRGDAVYEYDLALEEAFEDEDFDDPDSLGLERPPFDGCELTTLEVVYGGPQEHESEDGSWWARPELENPLTWIGDGDLYPELSAEFMDQEGDFLACVEERGHGEWTFDEFGWLPVSDYLAEINPTLPQGYPLPENLPEPPEDAPEGPDEFKAFEFAMALDFAECADEAGLREDAEKAWGRLNAERLIDRETEVFAWQDEVEEYLTNAQEYLQA